MRRGPAVIAHLSGILMTNFAVSPTMSALSHCVLHGFYEAVNGIRKISCNSNETAEVADTVSA